MNEQQHCPVVDVGAYAIGALEHDEAARLEAHLMGCDRCAAEFASLAPVAQLLADMPPPVDPPPPVLDRLLGEVTEVRVRQRRRRTRLVVAVACAAVVAVAGPVVTAMVTSDDGGTAGQGQQTVAGDEVRATDPQTGVEARIGLRPVGWGTSVDLDLRGVQGPLRCDLQAVGEDGTRETVTSWAVPAQGYAPDGGAATGSLRTQGGTSLAPSDIDRFEVVTSEGDRLVTVPTDPTHG